MHWTSDQLNRSHNLRQSHVRGLADHNATLTLTDDPATSAPSFADDTGDAQSWTQNTAIASITVPAASRHPHADVCGSWVASRRRLVQHLVPSPERYSDRHGFRHNHDSGHQLRGLRRLDGRLYDSGASRDRS